MLRRGKTLFLSFTKNDILEQQPELELSVNTQTQTRCLQYHSTLNITSRTLQITSKQDI